MTEYTQEEAVFRMNEMGKAGRPFLFIIDYKRERIYVESPEEIVDLSGRRLLLQDTNANFLELSGMQKGFYIVIATNGTNVLRKKLFFKD